MAAKLDQQELINLLKETTSELGKVPTQEEFCKHCKFSRHQIVKAFGSYSVLLQAADMGGYIGATDERRKLTNDIFIKDVSQVVESYEPAPVSEKILYTPTLVIGDTHFPFVSQRVLDEIYAFAQREKPGRIIQVGDLYDMYAHSKFPRSHNVYIPKDEEALARKGAEEMWKTLKGICPKAECIQLKGNHDIRPLKRTLENLPSLEHVIEKYLNDLMRFDGVRLIEDSRQEYIVEGIQFIHGYRSKTGDHRDHVLMNTVCGHLHRGGVVYRRLRGQTLFEMNAGLVGDPESKALAYTAQKIFDATPGFGFIDEYGPRFIAT